jgi:hypothetical protein
VKIALNRLLALFGCGAVFVAVLVTVRTVADAANQQQTIDVATKGTEIAKRRIKNKCQKVNGDLEIGQNVAINDANGKPTGRYLPPGAEICDDNNATAKLQADPQGEKGVGYVMSIERLEESIHGTNKDQDK